LRFSILIKRLKEEVESAEIRAKFFWMFVLFRYDSSLKDYLSNKNPSPQIATMLLAQLLEAVVHMNSHGIAHR